MSVEQGFSHEDFTKCVWLMANSLEWHGTLCPEREMPVRRESDEDGRAAAAETPERRGRFGRLRHTAVRGMQEYQRRALEWKESRQVWYSRVASQAMALVA